VDERFPALRGNLRGLYGAYYLAELLDIGTEERDPHPGLFDAGLAALRTLGTPDAADLAVVEFEMAWLRELGYSPRLDSCAVCGQGVPGSRLAFAARSGGVLCPACVLGQRDRRPLSEAAWSVLARLARGEKNEAGAWPPAVRNEVRQLLGHYISHLLGRRPRLLGYLE
jgi:DNA repair protein RecO (recombination protein O)